jgi:hypothetical protein
VIYNNANTKSLFPANAGFLQLSQCETAALAQFAVVTNGLSTDGGAEESKGANAKGGGLDLAGVASAEFPSWLIKPCADATLPVLAEVIGVEDYSMYEITWVTVLRITNRCFPGNPWISLDNECDESGFFSSSREAYLVS